MEVLSPPDFHWLIRHSVISSPKLYFHPPSSVAEFFRLHVPSWQSLIGADTGLQRQKKADKLPRTNFVTFRRARIKVSYLLPECITHHGMHLSHSHGRIRSGWNVTPFCLSLIVGPCHDLVTGFCESCGDENQSWRNDEKDFGMRW